MVTLGMIREKLAEAILQSGLTQKELAAKIGVKRQQISCYVRGEKMPALDTFANLCAVLEAEPSDILCLDKFGGGKSVKVSNSFNNNSGKIDFKA